MGQRMIVAYPVLKGPSARAIHKDLTATLGRIAVAYSSVTRHLREAHVLSSSQDAASADAHSGIDNANQALLSALNKNQFASLRQLSRLTRTPPTTVYRHLTESLRLTVRHLRWVVRALSDAQKAPKVDLSRQLLRMLEVQRDRALHDIVTLDQS
jgi:hypothetical protein